MKFDRRRFCALSAAALAARRLPAIEPPPASAYSLVAAVDRDRILRLANQWLPAKPQTITDFPAPNSPGTPHDFFSQADYFWPNPADPTGPWKEIDGKSNPANFQDHRRAMIRLSQAVPALTVGFLLTRRQDFASAAAAHLVAWFVTPTTRMNPSLQFAQGYPGGPTGRSYGIIDTLHLVEPARSAGFLKDTLGPANLAAVQQWFREYLNWMKTSTPGEKERDATNNHAIAWALQAAEFARLAADNLTLEEVRLRFENVQLPAQENAQGGFPRELARTKPYGYSIFQFDCATTLGWSLGILTPSTLSSLTPSGSQQSATTPTVSSRPEPRSGGVERPASGTTPTLSSRPENGGAVRSGETPVFGTTSTVSSRPESSQSEDGMERPAFGAAGTSSPTSTLKGTGFSPSITRPSGVGALAPGALLGPNNDATARTALCRAAAFLYPYLNDKSKWPYAHDIQHWDSWPVRSPGLLFCGLSCNHPEYIALWRRLDSDPTDPEIIRNFPIRQPLLWVA